MRKFDKQKFKFKNEYLEKNVYHGLANLNTGWDAPSIYYFNQVEFGILLSTVEKLGLGIYGIEPFDFDNHFFDVKLYNDYTKDPSDPKWYKKAFEEFKATGKALQYSASYYIPSLDGNN